MAMRCAGRAPHRSGAPASKDQSCRSPVRGSSHSSGELLEFDRELLELATDCLIVIDADWRFTYLNRRAREDIARKRHLLGKSLWTEFPALIGTAVEQRYRDAMKTRRPSRFEAYYAPLASWYEINVSPLLSGAIAVWFSDICARMEVRDELQRSEERYRLAASAATDLIIDWDLETGEIVWREALQSSFGFGTEMVRSREWCAAQVHPGDRDRVSAAIRRCRELGERLTYECRIRKADGAYADVQQTAVAQLDADGKPLRIILAARDVTERNRANAAIRQREAQLANVFSQALVGMLESGPDGRARLVNSRICEILGRAEDEIIGADVMGFTHPDDLIWNEALLRNKRQAGERFQTEKRFIRPDGSAVWCRVSVSFVFAPTGAVESSILVAEDITEQRRAVERLKWASEHDALTNLPNRRAFEVRLQAAAIRAMRTGGKVGLLLIDLDHFKHVNDGFGHSAGDFLLKEIGYRLDQCVESSDLVARLGGDEFAILVERDKGELSLAELGEAILRELNCPISFDARSIDIGASIGGAVFPADADNAHELLKHADIALHALKNGGRGGTKLFDQTMLERALDVASQLAVARSAVFGRSVDPHYQPKVDLGTGRIIGFESLLRWHHRIHGVQSPDTVAEAFRDYELASKIGRLVQLRVLSDLRGWLQQALPVGSIAINAAPAEFLRDDFAENLLCRLREHQVPPSLIEVEITEHVFLDRGSGFVSRALNVLNQAGVRIALDDFGTGYSSLSHLRDFPVDVVKIDRSFVEHIAADPEARAIVSAVVALARELGITIVAEGIETEQQRFVLHQMGCPLGQGYYFGRAIPSSRVPDLLRGPQIEGVESA